MHDMEARRRYVAGVRNNNRFDYSHQHDDDDEDDYLKYVSKDILDLYENDSETEHDIQVIRRRILNKRKQGDLSQWLMALVWLSLVGLLVMFANLQTNKDVTRIKADIGITETKTVHPDAWWRNTRMYYIDPRTFQDADNNGIGDIRGIIQHLDHLSYLQIDAVILGSIMSSGGLDSGKDITDFKAVDPLLGTMQDFEELHKELHKRGMRLIMEVIPNQTSVKHLWFQESRKSNGKYKDYYTWVPAMTLSNGSRVLPNNWLSRYGGSMWTFDAVRDMFYLHQFHKTMPDLNHRHPEVRQEVISFLEFWLDVGVDGFILQGVEAMFEIEEFILDEPPLAEIEEHDKGKYESLEHIYTNEQPEIHEYLATWREILDEFQHIRKRAKIVLLAETNLNTVLDVLTFYTTGVDLPFNFFLSQINQECDAYCVYALIDEWFMLLPEDKSSMWMMSGRMSGRMANHKGAQFSKVLSVLQHTLPGCSTIYYGDEIGMTPHPTISYSQTRDLRAMFEGKDKYKDYSQDANRTPMQWSDEINAGFTNSTAPWLPVNENYKDVNVKSQMKQTNSHLNLYRKLSQLSKHPSMHNNNMKFAYSDENIFSFLRYELNSPPLLVILHFGTKTSIVDYSIVAESEQGKVMLYVSADSKYLHTDTFNEGTLIDLTQVTLHPGDALIVDLSLD